MQYILTQEEFDALNAKRELRIKCLNTELQTLCTKIANEMPIVWGWGGDDPKPWGCVMTDEHEWYCDQCPVQTICPATKQWSK